MNLVALFLAAARRVQTFILVFGKGRYLSYGDGLHVGKGSRIWASERVSIGRCVYIGKQVNIEANCDIGDYCLLANRVAIIGRWDHDFSRVGFPVRFSPWVGMGGCHPRAREKVSIGDDVWVGYGAIILSGVTIGRGAVVAAGSVVVSDVQSYQVVGGVPARGIGWRLEDDEDRRAHEEMIRNGIFRFSEKGLEHCLVLPGVLGKGKLI